jgi:hypothetical protein
MKYYYSFKQLINLQKLILKVLLIISIRFYFLSSVFNVHLIFHHLLKAASRGNLKISKFLVDNGADHLAKNIRGNTPLQEAQRAFDKLGENEKSMKENVHKVIKFLDSKSITRGKGKAVSRA